MVAKFFLANHICNLAKFYNITLFTNLKNQGDFLDWAPKNLQIVNIPIVREISIINDIKVFLLLIKLFYKANFLLVHSVSPKAGLVTMIASYVNCIPVRIHTFTGHVWSDKEGIFKEFLKFIDRLIGFLASIVLVDSYSQEKYLLNNGIIKKSKSSVLANGSINGVDLNRFKFDLSLRKKVRENLKIPENFFIFLYLGRVTKEKGILELTQAFSILNQKYNKTELWIVGPDEGSLKNFIIGQHNVRIFPLTNCPESYMTASDVFCLPSYREGFGNVVIEAGACEIPTIGSNIYGLKDAIADGVTGILVEKKSVNELEEAMELLLNNQDLKKTMGKEAYKYSSEMFSQDIITEELFKLYESLLKEEKKKKNFLTFFLG